MSISPNQIHVGRVSLGLSVAGLAELAGLAPNTVHAIERGADHKVSTIASLASAMMSEGIVFFSDGSCGQRMVWEQPRPENAEVRAAALQFLNAGRKARGQCPLIDGDDS